MVNDTRVIPARLHTRKDTGGSVELLFLEPIGDGGVTTGAADRWRCLARARRPLRAGQLLRPARAPEIGLTLASDRDDDGTVVVEIPGGAFALLERAGELPLPPYIGRPDGERAEDRERYQTIFARAPGAVAAPTAGLHFTAAVRDALVARGCVIAPLTLHVGLGTFSPVRVDELDAHAMHEERYTIPVATAEAIAVAGAAGRPVVAIGTTAVRALESAATGDHRIAAGPGTTRIFIRPGFRFRVVDQLLTNFHLPESTLLMLVCAFTGYHRTLAAYRHAIAADYRFFSYGDAMLCRRDPVA